MTQREWYICVAGTARAHVAKNSWQAKLAEWQSRRSYGLDGLALWRQVRCQGGHWRLQAAASSLPTE